MLGGPSSTSGPRPGPQRVPGLTLPGAVSWGGGPRWPAKPSLPCSRWQLPAFSPLRRDRVSKAPRGLWRQVLWRRALSIAALVRAPAQAAPRGLGAAGCGAGAERVASPLTPT